ncbi:DUF4135 domain-containing protein, partial [Kibdelosporangium lantanae]
MSQRSALSHDSLPQPRTPLSAAEYAELLRQASHPSVLRDAVEREFLFASLHIHADDEPHLTNLVALEQDALWDGDIPDFWCTPGGTSLFSSDGREIAAYFTRSSLDRVRARVAGLDEAHVLREDYCARTSIRVVGMNGGPPQPVPGVRPHHSPMRSVLSDHATQIGDRLCALALRNDGEVVWPSVLTDGDDYFFGPTGGDLYSGTTGIALFLAYLARHTGSPVHADLARAA